MNPKVDEAQHLIEALLEQFLPAATSPYFDRQQLVSRLLVVGMQLGIEMSKDYVSAYFTHPQDLVVQVARVEEDQKFMRRLREAGPGICFQGGRCRCGRYEPLTDGHCRVCGGTDPNATDDRPQQNPIWGSR